MVSTTTYGAPATDPQTTAATTQTLRPALLNAAETLGPDPVARDPRAMGPDEWQTLTAGGAPFSLLYRAPAQAQASGSVLLVSDRSSGAASAARTSQLRLGLARLGYHTYLLGLSSRSIARDDSNSQSTMDSGAQDIAARVTAAISHMRANHGGEGGKGSTFSNLVISEGASGRWVAAGDPAGIDGLVFVDAPPPRSRSDDWLRKPTLPVLMVQTAPRTWPPEQPLGATTELHLLPRQSLRSVDGLLVRTVRGWVKRLSSPAASKRS